MECKSGSATSSNLDEIVLIETLWNVNDIYKDAMFNNFQCINRNIVECKFASSSANTAKMFVLIETLWNVNHTEPGNPASVAVY